ncbi:hypothetical protein [Candidatus Oscillochloris fontis]|uniref:hypothetical protein n=1 Tax=Candidatus Oscillochloris fontis TaxID=2496868 RepID=UPI00101C4F14|nr:hypothetical protein [Candidatus Oscillochloris fontis]
MMLLDPFHNHFYTNGVVHILGAGSSLSGSVNNMKKFSCRNLEAYIADHPDLALPQDVQYLRLIDHVASCARCQHVLLDQVADRLGAPLDLQPVDCDACDEDLPAYIDTEYDEGTLAAIKSYPHVWWHLWTCRECASSYQMILALQAAEAAGELPPITFASLLTPQPIIPRFVLQRSVFVRTLVPQFGVMWGGKPTETVIHDDDHADFEVRVSVRQTAGRWAVVVLVDPPVVGHAVVTIGAHVFRAPFDAHGCASLEPIPQELLTSSVGADMVVGVER